MLTSADILQENGLLSQWVAGFKARDVQQIMATAVEEAIATNSHLIVEAGTGTGKTFGYLIPAMLAQKKIIISTGTKNLQDQLYYIDIPVIKNILAQLPDIQPKIVLLKGRANYLCLQRLNRSREEGRFISRDTVQELEIIYEWSVVTTTGDISEIESIAEDAAIWPYVTSTIDNCLNQECSFYKSCHLIKARQQALAADIVVVNHHLFFADLALQQDGFGELLPGADVIIFDEAHHLPDIASYAFSTIFSSRQLTELARDSEAEAAEVAFDMKQLYDVSAQLQRATIAMRSALGMELRTATWPNACSETLAYAIREIKESLQFFIAILKESAPRSKALENCWQRATTLLERFNLITTPAKADTVHWYEVHLQSFIVHLTPIIVADFLKKYMNEAKRSWIFTSATLTVKNNFALFVDTLGLHTASLLQLKSPFDYQKQALLYAPRGLPDPHAATYLEAVLMAALPVLEASGGKAFLLFTSHKALEHAAIFLTGKLSYPLLKQGSKSKRQLIDEFKQLGNAILLGTNSFWYGVDVRGEALSCVIIDKLPFSAPEDPILRAKINLMREQGIDPFWNYQLPQAVLTLKQGAGRLIRGIEDRGVLMICDPRLVGNRYGEVFLQSLPDMPRTRQLKIVADFLTQAQVKKDTVT